MTPTRADARPARGGRSHRGGWAGALTPALLVAAVCHALPAQADAPLCGPAFDAAAAEAPSLDPMRLARAISLDLRGSPPTGEELTWLQGELQAAGGDPTLSDAAVDTLVADWLASPAFHARAARHHRSLLWNNVTNVRLVSASFSLTRTSQPDGSGHLYWRRNPAITYRGSDVPCLNEPATFDEATGRPNATLQPDGTTREGFVWVAPYWAPEAPIKVCAFDAQTAPQSVLGVPCDTNAAAQQTTCGCGPALNWCRYGSTLDPAKRAFGEAIDRRLMAILAEGRPWLDLLTEDRLYVNGPIVHVLRHLVRVPAGVKMDPLPIDEGFLPELAFTDEDTWVTVPVDATSAGVLTDPGYLMRFQTNRARAARFYDALLCQPFTAPDAGVDLGDAASALEPDLQKRSGCKYCHAMLEPSAAFWGRWREAGAGHLGAAEFPAVRDDCQWCAFQGTACSTVCKDHYLTKALSPDELPYLGSLKALLFLRDEHAPHVAAGPELLVSQTVVDGRLPKCVARRTAEWLLGRPVPARALDAEDPGSPPPDPQEAAWLDGLAADFVASGWDFPALARAIVTSPTYRRVR